ncbi:hypothetical protein PoB_006898500 [Plakobranchus ocellatus]|uniref:Protein quiver n=1 Tax=Plakobranchus ocellatus TaxID=259542 RepID=A0AAV4DES7_9GAST|nr:hypothetical protein PoB_006898500 [Plakobranchus ocellatus]
MDRKRYSWLKFFVPLVALLLLFTSVTECLQCFQCGTTSEFDECKDDWSGLVNTSIGITDKYAKDCTAANVNWTRCMILESEGSGRQTLFHRGCHDGVTFSKLYSHHRFENIPPNNESTCATIVETREFVCFRFCDTDYCNGPQPPIKTDPCTGNATYFDIDPATCGTARVQQAVSVMELLIVCAVVIFLGLFMV